MRNYFHFLAILFTAFSSAQTPELEARTSFTQSSNQFGFHLFKPLAKEDGNLLYSPFSIESALTLARLGASGETAKQMTDVLKLSPDVEKVQIGYWQLMKHLNGEPTEKRGFELNVANSLWLQIDFPFLPGFLSLAQKTFMADLKSVDFRKNTEESRKEINRWAAEKTKDKIPEVIAPGQLTDAIRLVLANAVYFKGQWQDPFEPKRTQKEKFFLTKKKTIPAELMYHTSQLNYLDSDGAQIIELPYSRSSLSMVIAVPKQTEGLKSLESKITYELVEQWMKNTNVKRVELTLPRFKFSAGFRLEKVLQSLGMKTAFNDSADFTGITKAEKIWIDSIAHKTFIGVDESGTEAAAVTAVLYKMGSAMMDRPLKVRADRPFLFFIRDSETGIILFIGRVTEPKW